MIKFNYLIFGVLLTILISCENKIVEIERTVTPKTKPDTAVSFSKDLIPIFNAKCSTVGCHDQSGYDPVLTSDVAYQRLMLIAPSYYVDTLSAATSRLYLKLTEQGSSHLGRTTPQENKKILDWIKQGAKNN
jgi:hypothetical protein